ncbi:MAG: FAD-binding oxidoreductase [Candidatus Lokiarchaeota archaeon]|nr:FAD-binding oxidoreductase [Candidatus Lokiarchaeota archaeon]
MLVEYDVIIIGAGSVGVPTALATAKNGLKTLVVDSLPSVAQGDNKHAIGGIRATHSVKSKIWLCQRSIDIFSSWKDTYGDDIWWEQGGYCFLAFTDQDEQILRNTVRQQKEYGLNINYIGPKRIKELIPGIDNTNLKGGTFSPEDGNSSPLLALHAFFRKSKEFGASYTFNESVMSIKTHNKEITGVKTNKSEYKAQTIINAAGAQAKNIGKMVNIDLHVAPESHEAGITEPVKKFFSTMVVDIKPATDKKFGNSKNYYFYQNKEGKIIFCLTPDPNFPGLDRSETSSFLPQITKRMVRLLPRLKSVKIRRTWRGLYPMTPDGNPIIGRVDEIAGFINAVGMCGQGFMLGPGLGELLCRIITEKLTSKDLQMLEELAYGRNYYKIEDLK